MLNVSQIEKVNVDMYDQIKDMIFDTGHESFKREPVNDTLCKGKE